MEEDKKETVVVAEKGVSRAEFNGLKEEMNKNFEQIVDLIKQKPEDKAKQVAENKKLDEANSDIKENNLRYDAKAREILGDKVEETFVTYPKGGGTMFTISIKKELSNAPKDYLEFYKVDHRTVNLEREEFRGEEGVEKWAKLVLANINRTLK
jgi:hypothetical protein